MLVAVLRLQGQRTKFNGRSNVSRLKYVTDAGFFSFSFSEEDTT